MRRQGLKLGFTLALLLSLMAARAATAATLTVTNTDDSGPGSLRAAIIAAASGDTITFAVTGTITLASPLGIGRNLTISGPGASNLSISGNHAVKVFDLGNPSITVNISGLTIENGHAGPGCCGGAISNYSTLTLTSVVVSGSHADYGGGINSYGPLALITSTVSGNTATYGGGIRSLGPLTLTGTTVTGNSASQGSGIFSDGGGTVTASTIAGNTGGAGSVGGGLHNNAGTLAVSGSTISGNSVSNAGAGVYNAGTVALTNSTVAGNTVADLWGGGVYNFYGGTLTLVSSTVAGNAAPFGGGLYNYATATLTLKNTIVAGSPSGGNCRIDGGTALSDGYNLSDDGSCASFLAQPGDLNGTFAGLDPAGLQDNGGPTRTVALLPTSPALDAVPVPHCTAVGGAPAIGADQRGVARPQGTACDIGAFELVQNLTPTYACTGFQPPFDTVISLKRQVNRAIPLKLQLALDGVPVTDANIAGAAPVVDVLFSAAGQPAIDVTDELIPLAQSSIGTTFRYDADTGAWVFNLSTKPFTAAGTYTVTVLPGDGAYVVEPACAGSFVRLP